MQLLLWVGLANSLLSASVRNYCEIGKELVTSKNVLVLHRARGAFLEGSIFVYFGLSQWPDIVIVANVLTSLARAWPITKYPVTLRVHDQDCPQEKTPLPEVTEKLQELFTSLLLPTWLD